MHRFLGLRPGTGFGLWAAAAGCEADVDTARDRFAEIWRNGLIDHLDGSGDGCFRFAEIVGRHAETEAEAAFGADEAAAAQRR